MFYISFLKNFYINFITFISSKIELIDDEKKKSNNIKTKDLSDAIDKSCDISKIKVLTFFDNKFFFDEMRVRCSQRFTQILFDI